MKLKELTEEESIALGYDEIYLPSLEDEEKINLLKEHLEIAKKALQQNDEILYADWDFYCSLVRTSKAYKLIKNDYVSYFNELLINANVRCLTEWELKAYNFTIQELEEEQIEYTERETSKLHR